MAAPFAPPPETLERLSACHARKLSVPATAQQFGRSLLWVRYWWRRLGLKSWGYDGVGVRERCRRALRRRLNQEGFKDSGDYAHFKSQSLALERGYPGASNAEANVLDAVANDHRTVPAICAATGRMRPTVYKYLHRLTRRGLLRKMDFFTWALAPRL